jgi:hypothetical protein
MSNSVSGAQQGIAGAVAQKRGIAASRRDLYRREAMAEPGARQQQFRQGTMNMLDEARGVVENAVGQGQELNPLIYQMLGLQPQYEDHSADLQSAQGELDTSQKQLDEANKTIANLRAIPAGRRSPAQRKQLRMLNKQRPNMLKSLQTAQDSFGRLQTMPKTITGLSRMDPSQIPANSPFSAANPLNQLQSSEAQRALQYTQAGSGAPGATGQSAAIDPTLVHKWSVAEDQLRASLTQRFGPDYESSSVGQMALSNLNRQKNESFATWNQQLQEKYSNEAFTNAANLNALLGQNINLMREPSTAASGYGALLSNLGGARETEAQTQNQLNLGRALLTMGPVNPAPSVGLAAAGAGNNVLQWATSPTPDGGPSPAGQFMNWATGTQNPAYQSGMEGQPATGNPAFANLGATGDATASGMEGGPIAGFGG